MGIEIEIKGKKTLFVTTSSRMNLTLPQGSTLSVFAVGGGGPCKWWHCWIKRLLQTKNSCHQQNPVTGLGHNHWKWREPQWCRWAKHNGARSSISFTVRFP